jgi:hypothetical protein
MSKVTFTGITRVMQLSFLAFTAFTVFSSVATAQLPDIRINALRYNFQTQTREYVHYDPIGDKYTLNSPVQMQTFVMGTSTINPRSGIYYVQSADPATSGVLSFDAYNGQIINRAPVPSYYPEEAEFDFQTGELYGLRKTSLQDPDEVLTELPTFMVEFVRFDPQSSTLTVIDTLDDINYTVLNSSTYNSHDGEYIVVGGKLDGSAIADMYIYKIDAVTGQVKSRSAINSLPGELHYDNMNKWLIGINKAEDGLLYFAKFDSLGNSTPLGDFRFSGYIASNSAFDQYSGRFIIRILESGANVAKTVVFNTLTGEVESNIETSYETMNLVEWEINNAPVVQALFRGTTSVDEELSNNSISIAPQPVTGNTFSIRSEATINGIVLYSLQGIELARTSTNNIDISALSNGVYSAVISTSNGRITRPVVIAK